MRGSWNAMVSDWVSGEIGSTYGPMLTETGILYYENSANCV